MEKSCVKNNTIKKTNHNYIHLRDAIFESGITNTELAKRIGVDKSRITAWCKGKDFPNEKNLQKLLIVLNEIQEKEGLIPYTIEYLRGDYSCRNIDNQEICIRTGLDDNAIATLQRNMEKDTQPNSLIPVDKYNHFTHTATANYIISQDKLLETFHNETKNVLLEIKQNYAQSVTYQDVVNSMNTYNSSVLNDTINKIFNNYIKESLKYYFPNE